ncbi:MAG: glycosyl hydrolase family 2 [Melioribacteraceae bacterium]|nr:glycosyl hydrolase family 2 [Melioribacteraceae bacterium]
MIQKLNLLSIIFLITISISAQSNSLQLPSIFSDNMVLQQESSVKFWGTGNPGSEVSINSSWNENAKTKIDNSGKWQLDIKTASYGGPYVVNVFSGKEKIEFKNILLGEVWVCSGQSNMEMPLKGWPPRDLIEGSESIIKNSAKDNIRLFTVNRSYSLEPMEDCEGSWTESNPETTGNFSATAYFFGKRLFDELGVPIGLIHTSWGGTPAEAWTKKEKLETISEFQPILKQIGRGNELMKTYKNWLAQFPSVNFDRDGDSEYWGKFDFNDQELSSFGYDDTDWPKMNLPSHFESSVLGEYDGIVWFRKDIVVPESWIGKNIKISLGPIDDMDATYINGTKIGGYEGGGFWQVLRNYDIPANLLTSNNISIAVRVIDTQGGGGIYGFPDQLYIQNGDERISLTGEWKFLPLAEVDNTKFVLFGNEADVYLNRPKLPFRIGPNTPSTLYNAMINPIIPYGIRGAIWYQGESNTGQPFLYQELFSKMIENWRSEWGLGDFPFYYVQIAPFNYGETQSQYLREAQFKTDLSTANTGMAVTLDIGNAENIHPGKKFEVGSRLALLALNKTYGKSLISSGPIYSSHRISGNALILNFENAENGLKMDYSLSKNEFQIAGEDKIFYPADVKIDGNTIICSSSKVDNPKAVRYAWSNTPTAVLSNNSGLPASSFRTDDW